MIVIEVNVFDRASVVASAEAETPEAAVYAGQTLYDEALPQGIQSARKLEVGFYVDGQLVRLVTGRPLGGAVR